MAEGFIVDVSHGTMAVSSWVEGAPQKSVWTGLKLSGKGRSEIATWRCNRCGFLEHYAVASPDVKHGRAEQNQVLLVLAISVAVLLAIVGAVLLSR
jgi:hypothetical protein